MAEGTGTELHAALEPAHDRAVGESVGHERTPLGLIGKVRCLELGSLDPRCDLGRVERRAERRAGHRIGDDGRRPGTPVIAERVDAWNRSLEPIGAVYLRRQSGQDKLECWTATCPHAGCFVDYRPANENYFCPCHNSSFALDGKILDPKSPSPRGLDELPVEVRNGTEVWVTFQNFRAGVHEKIPV